VLPSIDLESDALKPCVLEPNYAATAMPMVPLPLLIRFNAPETRIVLLGGKPPIEQRLAWRVFF